MKIKKEANIKKLIISLSELLVLFLVIFISLAIVGIQFSENEGENPMKPGLAPENPEFVKRYNNNIFAQAAPSQDSHKTGFVLAPVDLTHLSKISTAGASVSNKSKFKKVKQETMYLLFLFFLGLSKN